ncbi:MAG: transcriptional regulator [Deltaproteobacteria bacterium RIFCSPLOWO2_12_FULL_44_12]|nr:MAG: transcriptional regulator [Deltaproteobacteria bacterium RIFCSPHIGHO2_01_FULL_43_49]OGQ16213.1 MAG: transcriptional regulator [Deltaproteobacteria bacterium RIFCSPHIGHO2_02_FULL_44_53]OGQ29173.1 MAG: transcriptional regulator [Deltaproteobacteria bacterium RIFCSPHIGHO2_12_FULL_44_21]OGQ32730.1 MAG: transcriptional regulator [Deltaproteobacteria bacterium RIFCSPLOWO2_01_FULL_45_74]OGQ41832.1 MAG: transcriptional regulator [Deltaproteobacteria bacterium RIFCSPLOWO2_02_FULL_44_34]OGQ71699
MSGHSKWSTIKRKKGAADAKRGKVFSKVIREITIAARIGGADPNGNSRLRLAIDKAKAANMPADNVQRAIKKGTGEGEGANIEEFVLEGYGPGGVALLVEAMTDNHNRTVAEVRHLLNKMGGNLGEVGCVGWMFHKKGVLIFPKAVGEEKLMEIALDAGADDIHDAEDVFEVLTNPNALDKVKTACEAKGLKSQEASLQMIPQNTIRLEGLDAEKMLKLMEALEDHDDVQNVHANFDIDASVMEKLAS